jgi:dolichol-phosphate mannosyltransferase
MSSSSDPSASITVVVPFLNEAAILTSLIEQIQFQLEETRLPWNMVLVNDGSTDDTASILSRMAEEDPRLRVLHFSRNFGHQAAVEAGLRFADGDAVILMDGDGQDCPTAIPQMVNLWRAGNQVVYAVRFGRKESLLKRLLFSAFYRILRQITSTPIPRDAGNFSLMDRAVVERLRNFPESDRYLPGLRAWVGFQQTAIPVERKARHDDQPRVSFRGLVSLAKTALFGFSRVPLLIFYWMSIVSAVVSVGCISYGFYHKLFTGLAVPGWASITSVSAFFGAINSLGIAILGDYVARIYEQVRGRPSFVIARAQNLELDDTTALEAKLLRELAVIQQESARVLATGHVADGLNDERLSKSAIAQ